MGTLRRSPLAFTLAVLAYIGVALALEPHAGRAGVLAIGAATWLLLLAAVRPLPRPDKARVAAVVAIATGGEILGSLILGLYAYRRGGIPAFVPPGHGLVSLAGLRLAQSGFVRGHSRAVVRAAAAAGAGWAVLALADGPRPDVVGALAMLALWPCWRAAAPPSCSPACSPWSRRSSSTAPAWALGSGPTTGRGRRCRWATPRAASQPATAPSTCWRCALTARPARR